MVEQKRLLELDGLRGLAIIAVLLFHFADYNPSKPNLISSALNLGWMGVDLFFVLSGFLITSVLLPTKDDPKYFRKFFIRRALRILPVYYLAVFFFFQIELPAAHYFHVFKSLRGDGELFYWLQLSNWRSAFGELSASPVGPFWSLAIEEQFYLVWPFVVLLVRDRTLIGLCLVLAVTSALLRWVPAFQSLDLVSAEFLYRLTPFRLEPLCYGAIMAVLINRFHLRERLIPWLILSGVGGIAVEMIAALSGGDTKYTNLSMATYGFTGADLACAGLVGLAVISAGKAGPIAILRNPVIGRFGKYSFAIYVWHVQLAMLIVPVTAKLLPAGLWTSSLNVVVGTAGSYLVAACSWALIERPLLVFKDKWAPQNPIPRTFATTQVAIAPSE